MPWNRPTLEQLQERIAADFSGRLLGGGPLLSRSVLRVCSLVWSGACHLMHGFLAWMFRQVFPDTAESEYLLRWAAIWGVSRKPGSQASGTAVASGTAGVVIPEGTRYRDSRGLWYVVTAEVVVADEGTATLTLEAEMAGADANLEPGAEVHLVSPIAGLEMAAVSLGLSGGSDAEDDESLRSRLLEKLRNPPHGGNADDYVQWTLEVPGVTRAWCLPLWLGIGTVGVTFVCDDDPEGPIPSASKVAEIQAYLDKRRPVTAALVVFAPEPLPVPVSARITPYSERTARDIELELADIFAREGEPGTPMLLTHIAEAISGTPGEVDHVLLDPAANIIPEPHQLPVLGPVTIQGVG